MTHNYQSDTVESLTSCNFDPSAVVATLSTRLMEHGSLHKNDVGSFLKAGLESRSVDAGTEAAVRGVIDDYKSHLQLAFGTAWDGLTKQQKRCSEIISLAFENPVEYNRAATTVGFGTEAHLPATSHSDFYIQPTVSDLTSGLEAYDHRQLTATKVYSTVINIAAARQDKFGEAFFPTQVISPDEGIVRFEMTQTYVMTDFLHTGNGSQGVPEGFGSVSIIDALINPEVLRDTCLEVVPIYSRTNSIFAEAVDPWVESGVETGALKFNQDIDLLAAGHDNLLNPTQVFDSTDQLDFDVFIKRIFLKVTDKDANTEILPIKLGRIPGANAVAPNGYVTSGRELSFNFNTTNIPLSSLIQAMDGGDNVDSVTLQYLREPSRAGWQVYLDFNVTGSVNLETGNIRVNRGNVQIDSVWDEKPDADGVVNPKQVTNATLLTALNSHFASIDMVGYQIHATRTNLNRRTRGILVRSDIVGDAIAIPMGPPVSALAPVVDVPSLVDLEAPIRVVRMRNSQNALAALLEYGDGLRAYSNSLSIRAPRPRLGGVGNFIMRPYFEEATLDLATMVDSIRSKDRLEDVNYAIQAAVRGMVSRAWGTSGYGPAWQALGNENEMPVVNIGTNTEIGSYLFMKGDNRLLGDLFETNLVTTNNREIKDMIIINFSHKGEDPWFRSGTFYYMPELVSTLPKTTNGGQSIQLTVQNRNLHVCHTPIQLRIHLKNLKEVLMSKVPVLTEAYVKEMP